MAPFEGSYFIGFVWCSCGVLSCSLLTFCIVYIQRMDPFPTVPRLHPCEVWSSIEQSMRCSPAPGSVVCLFFLLAHIPPSQTTESRAPGELGGGLQRFPGCRPSYQSLQASEILGNQLLPPRTLRIAPRTLRPRTTVATSCSARSPRLFP